MKSMLPLLLTAALAAPALAADGPWTPLETLRPAGQDAVLTVEGRPGDEDSPRLTVAAGRVDSHFRFVPEGGVQPLGEVFPKGTPGDNTLESDYLYAPAALTGPGEGEWKVLAFGRAYASSPGPVLVVGLAEGWTPAPLLKLDSFLVEAAQDIDGDGRAELIGRPAAAQSFDECAFTYAPYVVYRQSKTMGPFAPDERLSAAWSRRMGYPWAGMKPRDDIAVDYCAHVRMIVPAPR